jgi:4-amino-4-deoxy-L-arabinose transferase-like glycosyltransferase
MTPAASGERRRGGLLRAEDWVLVIALALRVGWVAVQWLTRGPELHYDDERLHWQLATHLVHDGTLVSDDGRYAARMPLYPMFLALFAGAGAYGVLAVRLVQAGLGALTAVVAGRLAGAAWGARAALVAGLLVAVDPFGIFFTNLLLTESVFTLLLLATVLCAYHLTARTSRRGALAGLAILGAALVLTRPAAVLLLPIVWLLVWLFSESRGRRFLQLLVCPVVLAAALLPWAVRNQVVLGAPAWLSTNGGVTLYDAQGPQADGSSNQAFLKERPELQGRGEVELDRILARSAREQMRADPWRVLRLAGAKLLRTWSPIPNVPEYRGGLTAFCGGVYTLAVLIAAVGGLARSVRRTAGAGYRKLSALLWVPVVYFTLIHCTYIGSVRYRVPLMPLLAISAAATVRPDNRAEISSLPAHIPRR